MKALTIILRIRINYENAYIEILREYYKHKHNVNAYITLSDTTKTITSTF